MFYMYQISGDHFMDCATWEKILHRFLFYFFKVCTDCLPVIWRDRLESIQAASDFPG